MTTAQPLVTIVIPTYNRALLLSETVESALSQTYDNIEVIVIDDGSSDETPQVMKQLLQAYNKLSYKRYTPNRGANVARNIGIDSANGDYICFLDSDDTYLSTKIERQMSEVARMPSGRDHIVQCQIARLLGDRIIPSAPIRGKRPSENSGDYIFLNGGQSHTPLCLVNIDLARRVRFDERLPKLQDYDWTIRLLNADAEYVHLSESLATYRMSHGPQQISKSQPSFKVMNAWYEQISSFLTPRARAWLRVNRLAIYAVSENRRITALNYLAEGIRYNVASPHRIISLLSRIALPTSVYQVLAPTARKRFKRRFL